MAGKVGGLKEGQERLEWLKRGECPELRLFLERSLHRLSASSAAGKTALNAKTFSETTTPWLYLGESDAVEYHWCCLLSLVSVGVVDIVGLTQHERYARLPPARPIKVRFLCAAEALVRELLDLPVESEDKLEWRKSLEKHVGDFPGDAGCLSDKPITLASRSAEEIVQALISIGVNAKAKRRTLRQLSSRCFWGDSKFIEENLGEVRLLTLFPEISYLDRPLLIPVHLSGNPVALLLIENLDTYYGLQRDTTVLLKDYAVVYSQGNKLASRHSRNPERVLFSYSGSYSKQAQQDFEAIWFDGDRHPACYFWGDLDYSGMGILSSLRLVFTTMQAWQPGYQPMLAALADGHRAEDANKERQVPIQHTGCPYADEQLIPAINREQRFLDQEWVDLDGLL